MKPATVIISVSVSMIGHGPAADSMTGSRLPEAARKAE
jgi:hypothetical protein